MTTYGHHFWSDDISLRDALAPNAILTHAQITEAYLLGLAAHRGGELASLDRHLPIGAVAGGSDALELITP
jgi:hypothetical protein